MSATAQVMNEMIMYYSGDAKRINHFVKVYGYAAAIGELEGLDARTQLILEVAALVHDIGIKASEEKYGDCTGAHQEQEGPAIAAQLLRRVGTFDDDVVERVCYLVGHHHTYAQIDNSLDFQILVEADLLVNIDEDHASIQDIRRVQHKIFKTEAGTSFLQNLF